MYFPRFLLLALSLASLASAREDPVSWTLAPAAGSSQAAPGATGYYELKAIIQPGWHLYSPTTPPGGPNPTRIQLSANPDIAAYRVYQPQPTRKLDPNFQIETETYVDKATFLIGVDASKSATGASKLEANVRYQVCSDVKCLPPVKKTASAGITFVVRAPAPKFTIPAGYSLVPVSTQPAPSQPASASPVRNAESGQTTFPFLLTALGFGLAALFTHVYSR
jgi:hypothetical protein